MRGGLIVGALFVLPGALIVFALSWIYVTSGQQPLVAAAFFGIKAAVVALVLEALVRTGKRALKGRAAWPIAIAAFLALFVWSAPLPLVLLAAAAFGLIAAVGVREAPLSPPAAPAPPAWRALVAAAGWTAGCLAPVGLSLLMLGPHHVLTRVGQLFSTLAVVTFGGAYATLAYLKQEAVDVNGWLTEGEMIDGVGLAETTPGPLVLINQFVGFLAGWQGGGGIALAALCALMAAWCTFAPSFVWIFAGAPFAERLRGNRWVSAALKAITAAILGVIAHLALWFALHVIFGAVGSWRLPLHAALPSPDWRTFSIAAGGLCVAAAVALIRFRVGVVPLIMGAASSAVLLKMAGLV